MTTAMSARPALLAAIPELRAFAISLCGDSDQGDDLVQETLLRAWTHLAQFQEGTNMAAWLFTILRNHFFNECRRRRRWLQDVDGMQAGKMTVLPEQDGWAIAKDLRHALERLPEHQREAVILVGGAGMTTAEAASVCGCEAGTIKSRVNRGRARLAELLSEEAGRADPAKSEAPETLAAITASQTSRPPAVGRPPNRRTTDWGDVRDVRATALSGPRRAEKLSRVSASRLRSASSHQ